MSISILKSLSSVWPLFLSLFVMMLGGGLLSTLISIDGSNHGFSSTVIGIITTCYYLGYMAGSVFAPKVIKAIGYVRFFAAVVAIASIAAVIYPMLTNYYAWSISRLITGFCYAGIYVVAESWLNLETNNENRGQMLSMYVITLYIGLMLSQFLLIINVANPYFLFVLVSILTSFASIPLLLATRPTPVIKSFSAMSIISLYKRSPFSVITLFFANCNIGILFSIGALYVKIIDMPLHLIAWFIGAAYLGCILLQFPLGKLSDKIDRRLVILFQSLATTLLAIGCYMSVNYYVLIVLFGLIGGFTIPIYAVALAHLNDRLDSQSILSASATVLIISGLGSSISPMLTAFLMDKYDSKMFFVSIATISFLILIFGIYRMFKNTDTTEHTDFTPVGVAATSTSMTLENIQLELDFAKPQNVDENN